MSGILVAIRVAAASVSAIVISGAVLAPHHSPLHLGLLYLPEFGGTESGRPGTRHHCWQRSARTRPERKPVGA
ncbi:MAG: hypothetical protein ACLP50_23545 [Solirubrobacteraceae bacterium]